MRDWRRQTGGEREWEREGEMHGERGGGGKHIELKYSFINILNYRPFCALTV